MPWEGCQKRNQLDSNYKNIRFLSSPLWLLSNLAGSCVIHIYETTIWGKSKRDTPKLTADSWSTSKIRPRSGVETVVGSLEQKLNFQRCARCSYWKYHMLWPTVLHGAPAHRCNANTAPGFVNAPGSQCKTKFFFRFPNSCNNLRVQCHIRRCAGAPWAPWNISSTVEYFRRCSTVPENLIFF